MGRTWRKAYTIGSDAIVDVFGELTLERVIILFFQGPHVIRNVLCENVLPMDIGVERFAFIVVAGESFRTKKKGRQIPLVFLPEQTNISRYMMEYQRHFIILDADMKQSPIFVEHKKRDWYHCSSDDAHVS